MRPFPLFAVSLPYRAEDNAPATLYALVRALGVRVTKTGVWQTLREHPDSASLLGLSDTLTTWRIENTAMQLVGVEQFLEIPTPFIVHLRERNGWFGLVTAIHADGITWFDTSQGKRTEGLAEFGRKWSGVVLIAKTNELSGETNYYQNRKKERLHLCWRTLLTSFSLILTAYGLLRISNYGSSFIWAIAFMKAVGAVVSLSMLSLQSGRQHPLISRLCRKSNKSECQTVLNSQGARVWNWLSWAEIGMAYYAGGLLAIIFSSNPSGIISVLGTISILSIFYTFYSIYYQLKIAKTWCKLCLIIQVILIAEGLIGIIQNNTLSSLLYNSLKVHIEVLCYLLFSLLTVKVCMFIDNSNIIKFNNPTLPKTFFCQSTQYKNPPPKKCLVIGNPDAIYTITIIINLQCKHCHSLINSLKKNLNNDKRIKLNIIFYDYDDISEITHFASKQLLHSNGYTKSITNNLYYWNRKTKSKVNVEREFFHQNKDEYDIMLNDHKTWCLENKIIETPTVYFETYKISNKYINNLSSYIPQFIKLLSNGPQS